MHTYMHRRTNMETHIVCKDPCPHELHSPIERNRRRCRDLRTSRLTFLASMHSNAKPKSDRLSCAAVLRGSPAAPETAVMPMNTDFYAWGHETNDNSGMPGTKAITSSVLSPKMASEAISEHQIRVGTCP